MAVILSVIGGALGLQIGASEQIVAIEGMEVPFVHSGIGILSLTWALVTLLTICGLGFILLLVLALLKSTRGDNRLGPVNA